MVVLFSPTLKFESKILKTLFFERFCKYICQLLFCIYCKNSDWFIFNVFSKILKNSLSFKLNFICKDCLVAAIYWTPDLVDSIYADVVLRETMRIALIYNALHGLDLWAEDIMNPFKQEHTTENYRIECGEECSCDNVRK